MLVKEIMRKRVFTLEPGMSLRQARRLFSERGISGAPVVGPSGEPLGVISRTDLEGVDGGDPRRVEQVMTPYAVSMEEDTPVREIARQMLAKRIHRVIVTRGGKICGIVTSLDMLKALLEERDEPR
jgi:CBS domain-containing protein